MNSEVEVDIHEKLMSLFAFPSSVLSAVWLANPTKLSQVTSRYHHTTKENQRRRQENRRSLINEQWFDCGKKTGGMREMIKNSLREIQDVENYKDKKSKRQRKACRLKSILCISSSVRQGHAKTYTEYHFRTNLHTQVKAVCYVS